MNEILETSEQGTSISPGSTADPGTGHKLNSPPARPANLGRGNAGGAKFVCSAAAQTRGLKFGTPEFKTAKANYRREYETWQRVQAKNGAGTTKGKAAPKTGSKTGGSKPATGNPQPSGVEKLDVEAQPKDVPMMHTDAPQLNLHAMVKQTLGMLTDIYAMNKPLVDVAVVKQFGLEAHGGVEFVRNLWRFPEHEIDMLATPICGMIPDLPVRVQKSIEKWSNPVALIAAAYMLIVPRINQERQLLHAIREYNAGTFGPAQPSGQNTGKAASNGNAPNVNVTGDEFTRPTPEI